MIVHTYIYAYKHSYIHLSIDLRRSSPVESYNGRRPKKTRETSAANLPPNSPGIDQLDPSQSTKGSDKERFPCVTFTVSSNTIITGHYNLRPRPHDFTLPVSRNRVGLSVLRLSGEMYEFIPPDAYYESTHGN